MVNKIDLISDSDFIKLVNNSSNISEVLKNIGYSIKSNSWGYRIIKERMKKLNITFNKKFEINNTFKEKIQINDILTKNSEYNRTKLKERLISEGLKEYRCECCGISEWNNKPISLQLHHINGINNDNRLENLQLLCPNCHSQTENFGTRGKGRIIKTLCDNLPLKDKEIIMNKVREVGIVQARKELTYRNSLINAVVKRFKDYIVMIYPDGQEKKFNTSYDAAKFLFEELNIGKNIESNRSSISKCCSGKQSTTRGYKFYRRSLSE